MFSNTINELSGGDSLQIGNFTYRGVWIEKDANSSGTPNNYRFDDLEIYPLNGADCGIYLRAVSGQHRGITNVTVVPVSGTFTTGIDNSGMQGVYDRLHFEGCTDGYLLGNRGDADAADGVSAGIVISGVTGNNTVTTLVHLANTTEVHDVIVTALSARGGTNVLKDDLHSVTLTANYLGLYAIGTPANDTYWSTDHTVAWRVNNAIRATAGFFIGAGTAPTLTSGSGTPEAAVAAPIGSLFCRTDGGAGTSLYVKESGTGNTGWVGK